MAGRLRDKVALISGTAGGQGRRAAIHFAAEGAKIVGCDVKVAEAEETVAMVRAAGGEMVSLQPVDLTDESAVEAWIAYAVEAYGDFDILYNNAAVAKAANVEDVSRADWDWNFANELTLVFLSVQARATGLRPARRWSHHQRGVDRGHGRVGDARKRGRQPRALRRQGRGHPTDREPGDRARDAATSASTAFPRA